MENVVSPITEVEDIQRQSVRIFTLILKRKSLYGPIGTRFPIQLDQLTPERFSLLIKELGDRPDRTGSSSELNLDLLSVLHRVVSARTYQLEEILHIRLDGLILITDDKERHL